MKGDIEADVAVIGAGATGAAVAWRLASAGLRVVCAERGDWFDYAKVPADETTREQLQSGPLNANPNIRQVAADYPIEDDASPIKPLIGNGVGGGTSALAKRDGQASADVVWLVLLTGARRGEVLQSKWSDFDLESATWVKPAATVRTNRLHRVALSQAAVAVMGRRRERSNSSSPWVFPGCVRGHRVISRSSGEHCAEMPI